MNNSKETPKEIYYNNNPITNKTVFWDNFGKIKCLSPQYENNQTASANKVTSIVSYCIAKATKQENVSNINNSNITKPAEVIKHTEITQPSDFTKHTEVTNPTEITKIAFSSQPPTKTNEFQVDSGHLLNKSRQTCRSEPILNVTNDRGDNILLQKASTDGISKKNAKRLPVNKKSLIPKPKILKGSIYIKHAGNVYKSAVEAKSLSVYEDDVFKNFSRNHDSTSKNKLPQKIRGKNRLKTETNDEGEFEVVIYLSGLSSMDEVCKIENVRNFETLQKPKSEEKQKKLHKKKKSSINKINPICHKSLEIEKQTPASFSNSHKAKKYNASSYWKTHLTNQANNSYVAISSSDDDTDFELDESGNIVPKSRTEECIESNDCDVRNKAKSRKLSYRPPRSALSNRSRVLSEGSLYSTNYGFIKPRVTENCMWENFKMIFKNYSRFHGHSNEVITKKISTEWMKNAGVVEELLTQKETEDAFRSAAGTKITMNAQEYKDFLINLSLKKKMAYYEIYRKMCEM